MAARRLILVMLMLLGLSTAIAIVIPPPRDNTSEEETAVTGETGQTGATGTTGTTGGNAEADPAAGTSSGTVEANVAAGGDAEVVVAEPGQRLILTVETTQPAVVEIAGLGLTQTTTDYAPAVFDVILPDKPETIEVTEFGNDKVLASIRIEAVRRDRNSVKADRKVQ